MSKRNQNLLCLSSCCHHRRGRKRHVAFDGKSRYAYDYNNVWIRKINGSDKTIFIPENYQTVIQIDNDTITHYYLWTPNQQDKLLADVTTEDILWALTDHLGSIRDVVGTTTNTHLIYDAYGNIISGTNPILFGYTGKPFDIDTQLQNNINRWYDPTVGRWLSTDPVSFWGGDTNLYRYVLNCTTRYFDSDGLEIQIFGPNDTNGIVASSSDLTIVRNEDMEEGDLHHWFPQQFKHEIESRCKIIGFAIDMFATELGTMRKGELHYLVHYGEETSYNKRVRDILDRTNNCCSFLEEMKKLILEKYSKMTVENPLSFVYYRKKMPSYGLEVLQNLIDITCKQQCPQTKPNPKPIPIVVPVPQSVPNVVPKLVLPPAQTPPRLPVLIRGILSVPLLIIPIFQLPDENGNMVA